MWGGIENRDEGIYTSDTFQPHKPTHLDGRTSVFVYMYVNLPLSVTVGGGDTCDTAYMCVHASMCVQSQQTHPEEPILLCMH